MSKRKSIHALVGRRLALFQEFLKYPLQVASVISSSRFLECRLVKTGRFVAYQVSKRVAFLCQPILGRGQMEVELFNIPPLRVYRWEKDGA